MSHACNMHARPCKHAFICLHAPPLSHALNARSSCSVCTVASWNFWRLGPSCFKCQPMSHWDYRRSCIQPASCIVTIWDSHNNNNNSTMLSFWSQNKRLPPTENVGVTRMSEPAFLCLVSLWKQGAISHNWVFLPLGECYAQVSSRPPVQTEQRPKMNQRQQHMLLTWIFNKLLCPLSSSLGKSKQMN